MSHLQRLRASLAMVSMGVAMLVSASGVHAQQADQIPIGQFLSGKGYKVDGDNVRDLGNWNDCMNYKISAGMHYCPGFFFFIPTPPYPAPCIDFDYREPSAVVEVTCTGKSTLKGVANISSIFAGSNQREGQPNCVANVKTKGGEYQRAFNHAIVRSPANPASRLSMAASPIQVAQSYTCGILGVAGNMDLLQNLQNFSIQDMLNPSTWQGAVQDSLTGVQNSLENLNMNSMFSNLGSVFNGDFLTNIFTGIQQMVQGFITNLQSMFTQLSATLQGLMSGTLPLANVNMADMGSMAQSFLGMGDAMGASGAVGGAGDMLNAAIGATTAGNALQMLTQPGVNPLQAASLAESVQSALNLGLQGLGIGGGTQTGGKDTFYATNFTPERFGQSAGSGELSVSTEGQTVGRGVPTNVPNASYASWSFLALAGRAPDGTIKPVGFVEDGRSQVVFNTMLSNISNTLGWVDGVSSFMAGPVLQDAASFNPAELCSRGKMLESALESLTAFKAGLGPDSSPTQIMPQGSYLNATQYQVVASGAPVSSCPLTNAGFIAKLDNPAKLEVVNCTSVCHEENKKSVCAIVPKAGFGGSCYSNALSVQKVEGLYPACNGYSPARVANGSGGWRQVGIQYNSSNDHLSRINAKYRSQLLASANTATQRLLTVKEALANLVRTQGGACTALGNPTGPEEWLARTPMPSKSMTAQITNVVGDSFNALGAMPAQTGLQNALQGAVGNNVVNGSFGALAGGTAAPAGLQSAMSSIQIDSNLMTMTSSIDHLRGTLDAGPMNAIAARASALDPGTFPVVLDTGGGGGRYVDMLVENTDGHLTNDQLAAAPPLTMQVWTDGRYDPLMAGTFAVLGQDVSSIAELAGCSSKLMEDMMPGVPHGIGTVVGTKCWGDMDQPVGWSNLKIPDLQRKAAGTRAVKVAENIQGIVKDTSGRDVMIDETNLNQRAEATSMAIPAAATPAAPGSRNSKCYPEGSLNPAQYNPGESILPMESLGNAIAGGLSLGGVNTDADDGVVTLTYWKNTKCCIPPTCPENIRHDF